MGWSVSTCSWITQDCRIHSNRSGNLCSRSPQTQGGLRTSRDVPPGHINHGSLRGIRRGNPGAGGHPHASETGGSVPPRPDKDVPRELDSVLCYHRTSCCSAQGQEDFRKSYHAVYMIDESNKVRKRNTLRLEESRADTLTGASVHVACRSRRVTNTGEWLTVNLSTVHRMDLSAQV